MLTEQKHSVSQFGELAPEGDAPSRLVNFSSWLYLKYEDQVPYIRNGVSSFLAESLIFPRSEKVIIDPKKGFVNQDDGREYREVFDRAIHYYEDSPVLRERFVAEKEGFENAQHIIDSVHLVTGLYPPIIIASPPGEVYKAGDSTKSITFVGIPEDEEGDNPVYTLYTIPTPEVEIGRHWEIICAVSDVQESMSILDYSIKSITPESVVAFPILLTDISKSLDKLAEKLEYDSWQEIEYLGNVSSRFEQEKDTTDERRLFLVSWFSDRIEKYVSEGRVRASFDKLDEVMRQVFASERGGYFLENNFSTLRDVADFLELLISADLNTENMVGNGKFVSDTRNNDFSASGKDSVLAGLYWWIMSNPSARDSYMGTGCGAGGGGLENYNSSVLGEVNYAQNTTYTRFMGVGDIDQLTTTNTGKYTDYYDYKPGECKNCKQHKRYVARPKRSEVQCAGWCSDCEK